MNPFASLKRLFDNREYHTAVDELMKAADDLQDELAQTVTYVRSRKECDRREHAHPVPIDRRKAAR